jgi:hypothetical protein
LSDCLSVLDMVNVGSSCSVRSFMRFGSTCSVSNYEFGQLVECARLHPHGVVRISESLR